MRFSQIAANVVKTLADEMFQHGEFPANWKTIHRLEKRFKIQGCGAHHLETLHTNVNRERRRRQAAHYRKNPDNHWHEIPPETYHNLMKEFSN